MADAQTTETVDFPCICGERLHISPALLGRIFPCPQCNALLRPSLQFLLIDQKRAPNLTVQCTCGHFVIKQATDVGQHAECLVCGRHLILPQPVIKFNTDGVVRVRRKVLENQLRKAKMQHERSPKEMTRLESASHHGRITLRPGEHICVNLDCGALLGPSSIICCKCSTNRLTSRSYHGPGPDGDPKPAWKPL